ncbi:MAG: DUF2063 domain-containing protein [Alphaproteobacteria bacterium]|nr:MAG: DUF2063 domain-containing protein [Alphaproteobacteria bacterium]
MPALHKLQQDMMSRILREDSAEGLPIAKNGPFTPDERLQVYKNNTHLTLLDLLKDVFPVTTILLGEKFLNFAGREFIRAFPPESGDMNGYGGLFPEYLARLPNLNQFPYVPDVAKLEWLAHESYLSPRRAPLTGAMLAAVEDPVNLKLHVQPHVFLLRSAWPVDRLWHEVSEHGEALKDFKFEAAETFAAIYREERRIAVWTITEGAYKFLEHLQSDPALAFAAETAMRAEGDFPLDKFLATLLQLELLAAPENA